MKFFEEEDIDLMDTYPDVMVMETHGGRGLVGVACGAHSPGPLSFRCTRPAHHQGDHVAGGHHGVVSVWKQETRH